MLTNGPKNEGSQFMQYLASICASITMATWGTHLAWTSPAIPYLTSNNSSFPVTVEQASWIVSIYYMGDLIGSITNPLFIDRLGRKNTLLLFAVPGLISWTIIIFAKNYVHLYTARFIAGIGQGNNYNSMVIYLTEISEKKIRGIISNMIQVASYLGIFIFTSAAAYTTYDFMNISSTSFPILFLIIFPFLPETPYYYLLHGQDDAAMKCLMKLRGMTKPDRLEPEIREMKLAIEEDIELKRSDFRELVSKSCNRKGLVIMFCVKMTQLMSGIAAITSYAEEIFSYSNPSMKAGFQVMILNGISLLTSLCTNIVIDRFSRRKLFLSSGLLASFCLGSVGFFFFIELYLKLDVSSFKWVPLVALILYQIVYLLGIGSVPYVIQGEIFPMNVKGSAVAYGMILGSIFAFCVTSGYKALNNAAGVYSTFWFFSIMTLGGSLITYWITPETKGMTLEEIQAVQNPKMKEKLDLARENKINQTKNIPEYPSC